jgi:hypothetical protein
MSAPTAGETPWCRAMRIVGGSQAKTLAPHTAVGLDVPRSRAPPRLALTVLRRASARYAVPTRTTRTRDFDFGVILHLFHLWGKCHCRLIPTPLLAAELEPPLKKTDVFLVQAAGRRMSYPPLFPHSVYIFDPCTTKVRQFTWPVRHLSYLGRLSACWLDWQT